MLFLRIIKPSQAETCQHPVVIRVLQSCAAKVFTPSVRLHSQPKRYPPFRTSSPFHVEAGPSRQRHSLPRAIKQVKPCHAIHFANIFIRSRDAIFYGANKYTKSPSHRKLIGWVQSPLRGTVPAVLNIASHLIVASHDSDVSHSLRLKMAGYERGRTLVQLHIYHGVSTSIRVICMQAFLNQTLSPS